MTEDSTQWLVELYEQQGASVLFRLAMLLGAGENSPELVQDAFLALHRRAHRVIDPAERVEYLQEGVVHLARTARTPEGSMYLPRTGDEGHDRILAVLDDLPVHLSEHLIVSHYLAIFGPELGAIMRMSIRRSNRRLETALMAVHRAIRAEGSLEATAEQVMAALRASARGIQPPSGEGFEAELAALPGRARLRISSAGVVVIAMIALLIGFLIAGMTRSFAPPLLESAPDPPAATATPEAHALPALVLGVPVYYVGRSDGLLYPEFRDLPASGELARTALEAVFSLAPLDPDYRSLWSPGQVLDIQVDGFYLTVDLSASAYESLSGQDATAAINQVVYTAARLIGTPGLRVRFLADGEAAPAAFDRAEGYTTQGLYPVAPVRITTPKNLTQWSAGRVEIRGEVNPGFGPPQVTITDTGHNRIVAVEDARRSEGPNQRGWDEWSLTVELPAGDYDVTVAASDEAPSDSGLFADNKQILIR